jgi:hypothetical protein
MSIHMNKSLLERGQVGGCVPLLVLTSIQPPDFTKIFAMDVNNAGKNNTIVIRHNGCVLKRGKIIHNTQGHAYTQYADTVSHKLHFLSPRANYIN